MTHRPLPLFLFLCLMTTFAPAAVRDTTAAADTTAVHDSLRVLFIPGIGAVTGQPDSGAFAARNFLWTDASTVGSLFLTQPGMVAREMGSPGLPVHLSIHGVDWRRASWLLDGRPLIDPVTGTLNMLDLPLEFVDYIELMAGHDALPFGPGPALNVVTRQYNTGRPVTKIRFLQGPDEHLLTDALFTQNITRPVNLMIGIQRHTSEDRFVNSRYDSWNLRSRLRFNVSDRLNFTLTDLYRRSVTGMNNGIDLDSTRALNLDVFNDAEALVVSRAANETFSRRDLTLSATGRIGADSLSLTHGSLYFSTAERRYQDPLTVTSGPFDAYNWDVLGGSVRQVLALGPARAMLGVSSERHRSAPSSQFALPERSVAAWFGEARLPVAMLTPAISWRGERNGDGQGFSYSIGLSAEFNGLRLNGAWASTHRFPSLQEINWPLIRTSGTGQIDLKEQHETIRLSALFSATSWLDISGTVVRRSVTNFLSFVPLTPEGTPVALDVHPEMIIEQASGSIRIQFGHMEIRGGVTITRENRGGVTVTTHPELIAAGEAAYQDRFFDNSLNARFVLRWRTVSRHQGVRYVPASNVFPENRGEPLGAFSTADLYGVFQIGDAFVTLSWENPLDRRYFLVYAYPALGRNVKIGLNWIFLD